MRIPHHGDYPVTVFFQFAEQLIIGHFLENNAHHQLVWNNTSFAQQVSKLYFSFYHSEKDSIGTLFQVNIL
jgi:hypothetical protein